MEGWASVVYQLGVGVGLLLIALALLVAVLVAIPLLRESRRLATDARRLVGLTETELRPALAELRELTQTLNEVAGELRPRLDRVDTLAGDAEETMESVRRAADAVARYADLPAAGVASVAAGLRQAASIFGRGRRSGGPVESGDQTEGSA